MKVRLVVTITAAPGRGSELAQAYKTRCEECMKEPGCEQFEVFQSVLNPDKLALLERWSDQALDTHAKLNATRSARASARITNTIGPVEWLCCVVSRKRAATLSGRACEVRI